MLVLPTEIIIPTQSDPGADPVAPGNLATAPAEANFKIWIYDPRNPTIKLASDGIFLKRSDTNYVFYKASADGTLNLNLGVGNYAFDVLEPGGTSNIFTRASYQFKIASAGTIPAVPSASAPQIPSNLIAAPAGSNFKLWVYDPRNPSTALRTDIFITLASGGDWTKLLGSSDASIYSSFGPGTYILDVAEPDTSKFGRRRYTVVISSLGVASIEGVTANADGVLPVTVNLLDQQILGAATLTGHVPNANGVFAVTVDTIAPVATSTQQRRDKLIALANDSAANFKPTSACQLLDQVTPVRTINGLGLSAGFPKVRWRLPSYGHIRSLIVPVDFPDVHGVDNAPAFFTPLANSVRDFYYAQSYGRVTFDFEILPNWVRLPFSVSDFGYGATVGSGDPNSYLKEVLKLTDPLFDFDQYDAVYFLVPKQMPFEKMGWGPAITHPYWTRNGYITNGATGGADMYLNETNGIVGAQWKWMTHETGHAFGLYDEDFEHQSQTMGSWGVMANSWTNTAIEHNGWDRYLQGWLGESQVKCLPRNTVSSAGITVKLNPLVRQNSDIKVAMVPLNSSKILVMESRKNEGFDKLIPEREGVLVYTVDMKLGHLKGGYQTQRRPGSNDPWFEDAALHAGDTISIDGVTVTVVELSGGGDTVKISK